MKIINIKVQSLFSLYNYDIPLQSKGNVNIITGYNGMGKSTILKMLHCVFNQDWKVLESMPFAGLSIEWEDHSLLSVTNQKGSSALNNSDQQSLQQVYAQSKGILSFTYTNASAQTYRDMNEMEFSLFISQLKDLYIEDSRLGNPTKSLSICGSGLADFIQKTATAFGNSVAFADSVSEFTRSDFERECKKYEKNCKDLVRFDILDKGKVAIPQYGDNPVTNAVNYSSILRINKAYQEIEKSMSLLKLFDKLIVGSEYIDKKVFYSKTDGILFKSTNSLGDIILLEQLSSGEKHKLMLYYDLVFNTSASTLVLMDEPEMSFHLAWQMTFLTEMERISKEKGFQMLMATHSPEIINGKWEITYDLYKKAKKIN